jgi:hypothetical protein
MLVMWRDLQHEYQDDERQRVDDTTALDQLLDRLHQQASADDYPHAVVIYAGNTYPEIGHGEADRWIPASPGDGPQPVLMLTVGTSESPVYWTQPDGQQQASKGPRHVTQPEPRYFFEYYYGGQESYATESSLLPREQARDAARLFVASDGKRPDNITWHTDDETG